MNNSSSIVALMCLIFLVSCDSKTVEPNPLFSESELFPLAVGKTFNYWLKAYDTEGKEVADRRFSQNISGDTFIAGQRWFKNDTSTTYVSNQADGLHYFYTFNEKETLVYKYPAEKGDVFNSFSYTSNAITDEKFETITGIRSVEVLSTNTSIVSPLSGTKYDNCIHYVTAKFTPTNSSEIRIYPTEQYVVPGKGAVLIISYYDENFKDVYSIREQLN
ncbi:hypothetical protein SAMN06298216_0759 [Spirosomataceae bacterium TFI 002]|nr:hypothetical protein SAMN06298216_0759 [Spirosomataceae bacterium TFI 002]